MEERERDKRVKIVIWGIVAALVALLLYVFQVTPTDVISQISRCISCH